MCVDGGDGGEAAKMYVGVVEEKGWGGVFVSDNGGLSWTQKSAGLNGNDVFSLGQASNGTVLAGTGHGIYRLQGEVWSLVKDVTLVSVPEQTTAGAKSTSAKSAASAK